MRTVCKTSPILRAKALTGTDAPGTFEAVVSVFDTVDTDGEAVARGAFADTLNAWAAKTDRKIPILWSHDWMVPAIGETLEASETDEGLYVKGRLFIGDDEDVALARHVHAAMRSGALGEFSWSGRVTTERIDREGDTQVVWLDRVELSEYGPCHRGANPDTRLEAIKSQLHLDGQEIAEQVASHLNPPPPRGGGDPQQRARVASLLLPDTDPHAKEGITS